MLTFEHSVLFETAGTARKTVCSTETQFDEREAMKCFCCLHTERNVVSDSGLNCILNINF